ncbi:M4 family metallopeptidase [Nocardioides sp. CCNWLW239]|uniref:M4 family metallopeptidase n=1 Tax=Nocardioides sp. CCNWLW239 TaxID=3128902 RepID=UPI0030184062
MSRHGRVVALAAASLALGGVSIIPMTSHAAEPDPIATYRDRAGVPLTIHRTAGGEADFIGAKGDAAEPLGGSVAPGKAARTHLAQAGKALGTDDLDLREKDTTAAVGGGSVTRFDQYVDGVPVLGGEVVVGLDEERGLTSAATNLSDATSAQATSVSRTKAAAAAKAVVAKAHQNATGDLTVEDQGVWLYDDELVRGPQIGTTSVRRLSVSNGSTIRETVLVHAGTGRVLMHVDEIAHANRRICDNANVRRAEIGCADTSTTVKRREGDPASGIDDVDGAYDLLGATADLYASLDLDLTAEIGWSDDATTPAITATTRYCEQAFPDYNPPCPMDNAFWNGQQIYLGQGLVVDDIVAHELTHGVIERSSNLFYWYESGAINESLADIMGEIVDHRYATAGDSPTDWRLGEDSSFGAIRDLANPTVHGQPDRMTSSLWDADDKTYYADGGGVHTNSGVGNKTAYLISQGGSFNGRTMSGIDGDDASLQKTATLYLYTIQHLVSGSQYADLGRTLVTGCDALAAAGTAGFTAADCAQVRLATEATELAKSPTKAGATRPAEAPSTCPAGSTGKTAMATPSTSRGGLWTAAPNAALGIPANDRDGNGSEFGMNPDPDAYGDPTVSGLTTSGFKVPAGKRAYLRFSHWYLFEWYTGSDPRYPTPEYYDGGEARLLVNGVATAIPSTAWVNGPKQKLLLNNPSKPLTGFGGDSNGWISSRIDLSAFAGKTVQLQWLVRGDQEGSFIGWFIDGVELYTCNPQTIANTAAPRITGTQRVGYTLTASKGSWSPAASSVRYQWLRNGAAISGATGSTYKLTGYDHARTIQVRVTAYSSAWPAANPGVRTSSGTGKILAGYLTSVTPTISGTRRVGYTLTAVRGTWKPGTISYSYQWLRNGKVISGATGRTYRLRSIDRGDRIRVRVTGRKTGYYTKSATSAATGIIR